MATARRSAHIPALRSALVAVILCMVAQRTVAAMCGDGLREDGEQCEDGNTNSGDGCSSSCQCEADPCRFTVASASVNLASVVTALAPGATVTLAAGTYAGDGSCGWSVPSLNGTDERSITVRGAAQGRVIIDCAQRGPVVEEAVRGTHLRLENLDLTNAHRSGGGGAVVQAERGSNIELVNCRVTNAASDGEGGAVLVSNSSLRVSGSHFEENSAVSGGALAIVDGSAALLEDTTVTHCFATSGGGGAYVARKSTLDMQGMHFSLNDGGPFGGALHSTAECTVQASTTTMTGNTATRAGAIRFDGGGVLRLTNGVHIIRNVAVYAGGIYVYGFGPETKIFDATGVTEVSKNIGRGGLSTNILVYTTTEAPCIVTFASDVRIRDGWAENYGAGLVAMNAIVHLRDGTTVAGNIAGVEGAGILALQVTLIVSGRVTIEDNHGLGILPGTGEIQKNAGGGGIWWASGWGVALLSSGVILRGNSCINGGAFFCEGLGSDSVLLDDVSFTDNFARFDGAGAFLSDSDASIRNVLFRNNTALANGGGLSFQGGMDASVSSCSFVANKALNGGGLAAAASSSIIHVHLATFDSNHALYEGGAMYATGSASLTINETTVTECTAQSGGGIATRGESVLTLKENVAIRRCEAPTGLGGGILVAGASLTITVASRNQPVVVESNSARRGGGVAYMAIVTLEGESTTFVQKNRAADKGGGVYGFSSYAKLYVAAHHSVMIQENEADTDGGGIALGQGAQVTVAPPACSDKCLSVMRGNEQCNVECLTAGCNWDDGDCNKLFVNAGAEAQEACPFSFSAWGSIAQDQDFCNDLNSNPLFTASCDWHWSDGACDNVKQSLGKCPLFDAVAMQSLTSVPGLVFLKKGRGFTLPNEGWPGAGPYPYFEGQTYHQGEGRCVNAVCRTDPPPAAGDTSLRLAPGEAWCDTVVNWGGQVIQGHGSGQTCYNPFADLNGGKLACIDTGQRAWGACAEKVKLPSSEFDYDAQSLAGVLDMSVSTLLSSHPGCGTMPLAIRSNRAGRYGGGFFQQDCDQGFEQKELCWLGGLSVKDSAAFILSFEENFAAASGGAVYTTCFNLGKCQAMQEKVVGLPSAEQVSVLVFDSNTAGGYGHNIGLCTAPNTLVVKKAANTHYVPGKDVLDFTLSILDAQGQVISGSHDSPVAHLIQVMILPTGVDCATFEACEGAKLQPTQAFLSSGTEKTTQLLDHNIPLTYCQVGKSEVNIRLFVSSSSLLDVPSDWALLQQTVTVSCKPCTAGWTRQETSGGLRTCVRCDKKQYVMDPNEHRCQACPAGATCEAGSFAPTNPADSVWNSTSNGIYRITSCPAGYVLIREDAEPTSDRCVACPPDTYSVEEAVFGERLWDRSVENYNQYCHPCPRSRAMCSGENDVRPIAGFWSPLNNKRDIGIENRRQEEAVTADTANRGRSVTLYRCIPPTACLPGNESYPNGLCMPGAYGPLCGICNETDGYAKSKDGCRRCDEHGTKQSTTEIAAWTGVMGVPIFLAFWYFFALRPLVTRGVDEEEEEDRPEDSSAAWSRFKARMFFCLGRASEHPIWLKTMAPVIGPAQTLIFNCVAYVVKNNPKDYIKIIVSFYQVSTAFSSNIDVKWPDSVTSVWKFFAFLTMEIFKLYGYDCMFGGINYLGRLALVTTVPMIVALIFILPWIASFFYQTHRKSRVFDTCANSVMWVIYLIYPLLCLMTIQGFKCVEVEGWHLLAADMKEPCPWKESERGSWIFVWSVASMVLYPIGIPVILLACLLRLDLPRLSRHGKGEAIFRQLINLYIKHREESVCYRIATHVGGSKGETQVDLAERAALLHREVSGNGEHAVTSEQFINWLAKDVTEDDREEMAQIFAHFDDDGNGALDEEEMIKLLTFLIDANSRIHVGLTLCTVKTMDLKTMADHFLADEERERAQSSGLTRLFLKQLKQEAGAVPVQRRASLMESSSFRSQGSSSRQSSSSMAGASEVADTDVMEKDKIIDSLLDKGRKMIRQGVFALPKLAWNTNEAHPEEKRVLQMIGFLLDSYHKDAWWWELFEMWRKFMLAGAIILIPTEGGKQIAFALLISTICLYTSLRTSPYIVENLLKLHIMSLTAQCITLFYALLLEIQDLSSVAEICADGKTCNQRNISDAIMESLLSLLQVSVFVLPVGLLLRDKGVFDALGSKMNQWIGALRQRARVSMGHTVEETKMVRWPSSFTCDDSASIIPLRSRKKGLNQAPATRYSSRQLMTARGATTKAAARPRMMDCIEPVEDEISTAGSVRGDSRTTVHGVGVTIGGVEDTTTNAFPPMLLAAEAHLHDTVSEDEHTAPDGIEASNDAPGDGKVLRKHASSNNRDNTVALLRAGSAQAEARENLKAAKQLFDADLIDERDFKKANADIFSTLSSRRAEMGAATSPPHDLQTAMYPDNKMSLPDVFMGSDDGSRNRAPLCLSMSPAAGTDLHFAKKNLNGTKRAPDGIEALDITRGDDEEQLENARTLNRGVEMSANEQMERGDQNLPECRDQDLPFPERVHTFAAATASEHSKASKKSFPFGSPTNAWNDTSATVPSLGDAVCGYGCDGEDSIATHWCIECHVQLCNHCVITHLRRPQTRTHAISELSCFRAQQELEDKLYRVNETSLEQKQRSRAQDEEYERAKLELSSQFKAEEEKRMLALKAEEEKRHEKIRQLVEEAAQNKGEEEKRMRQNRAEEDKRMRQLEEQDMKRRRKEEEEERRRKEEEDELVRMLREQKLAATSVSPTLLFNSLVAQRSMETESRGDSSVIMPPSVWTWSLQDVAEYVQGLQDFGERAGEYAEMMVREEINGQTFSELNDYDLKEMKLPIGHRKLLLSRIALLKRSALSTGAGGAGAAEASADFISVSNA